MNDLNDADIRILDILRQNGRISWTDMATIAGLSPSACQRRTEALRRAGVITGFTATIDRQKTGQSIHAFIHIKVERQKIDIAQAFRRRVRAYPQVQGFYKLSGAIDYLVDVYVADIAALSDFIDNKLLALEGVVDASSSIVLEEL